MLIPEFVYRRVFVSGFNTSFNDFGTPNNFLTCWQGPPLSGFRCGLRNVDGVSMGNNRQPVIVANKRPFGGMMHH